jgi:hypothetical protein
MRQKGWRRRWLAFPVEEQQSLRRATGRGGGETKRGCTKGDRKGGRNGTISTSPPGDQTNDGMAQESDEHRFCIPNHDWFCQTR